MPRFKVESELQNSSIYSFTKTSKTRNFSNKIQTLQTVPVDKIPSPSDLDMIRESIKRLKMLRDERWMEFSTMREECTQNLNIMGERPKTTFEAHGGRLLY